MKTEDLRQVFAIANEERRIVEDELARLRAENERLRSIISQCVDALHNGSVVKPDASLDFMAGVPQEVGKYCAKLRDALKSTTELLSHSDVKYHICNGGRGHLGEQSWYFRVINAARAVLAGEEERECSECGNPDPEINSAGHCPKCATYLPREGRE